MFNLSVYYMFLQYFPCSLGLLTCKNRLPYNLYCVGGDVKHCSIQSHRGQGRQAWTAVGLPRGTPIYNVKLQTILGMWQSWKIFGFAE